MRLLTLTTLAALALGSLSNGAVALTLDKGKTTPLAAFDGDDAFDGKRGRGRGRGGDDDRGRDRDRDDRGGRDDRGRDDSGRDRPRIPGGSGCDDPGDLLEHPECRPAGGSGGGTGGGATVTLPEPSISGRDRPRIPGGSGCDDPDDHLEHPECRG